MLAKRPAHRPGTADEVVNVAELLLSTRIAFSTGADLLIDGGATASWYYGLFRPQSRKRKREKIMNEVMQVTLSNGVTMPQLGYGVYQVTREECERCVTDALAVGYRHIDTAQSYFNETEVGAAIRKSGIPRKDIFLTTKVWIEHYGYDACRASVMQSLERLGTDYIDLVLLHQPFSDYYGAWRALEDLYVQGVLRAIGVSNFAPDRLVDLCSFSRISPMVNQVETHPHNQQAEAHEWMKKYGVQHEAWAPFGEGRGGLFTDPVISGIARKYGRSTAQVMLRWALQRGIVVIPKSVHKERMEQNFRVFDFALSDEDMATMTALDKKISSFFSHTDPNMVEWFVRMVEERKNNTGNGSTEKNW